MESCEVMNWVESNSPHCLGLVMKTSTRAECRSVVLNGGIFGLASMMCRLWTIDLRQLLVTVEVKLWSHQLACSTNRRG